MDKVSIIIPFYNGNKYLSRLKQIFDFNYNTVKDIAEFEIVVVNDSPWIDVDKSIILSDKYDVKIINHKKNGGIHQARTTGIRNASGDYVLMLDQDDVISRCCIRQLFQTIKSTHTDCVIGNGVFETDNGRKLILNSYGKVILAKKKAPYLIVGNLLCSPGQCMLRKKAIPEYWLTHIIKSNCSDDLFLWCLLFGKRNISYCNELVYLHVNTGVNFSLDKANGYNSDLEVLHYLKDSNAVSGILLKIFGMRYDYNMQKLNHIIDNKYNYSFYYCLCNACKVYMCVLSYACLALGKRVSKLEDAAFDIGE